MAGDTDLDKAELFKVAVERVRLGIDRDPRMRGEEREDASEGVLGIDERLHGLAAKAGEEEFGVVFGGVQRVDKDFGGFERAGVRRAGGGGR